MSDLISRQAAIDALDKRFDSIPMEQTTEILLLRKDLRDLLSADVVPVVHGRWSHIAYLKGIKVMECSHCGKRVLGSHNYCGNRGAKMDGKGEE